MKRKRLGFWASPPNQCRLPPVGGVPPPPLRGGTPARSRPGGCHFFAGGQMSPAALIRGGDRSPPPRTLPSPRPRVEAFGSCTSGDGRSKSGLRLHSVCLRLLLFSGGQVSPAAETPLSPATPACL